MFECLGGNVILLIKLILVYLSKMPRLRGEICKSNTKSQQINLNVADSHYGVHYWMDQCPVMVIRPLRKRSARPIQLFPVIFCIFFYILVSQIWDFGGSRRGRRDKKISQSGVNQPTTTSRTPKVAVSRWFFIKKTKKTKRLFLRRLISVCWIISGREERKIFVVYCQV